jgi:4-hydroxybenzoate polyprenyltransferase
MPVPSKFNALLQLIRFDKPIGTLLLLWPTLWALWIAAEGLPDGKLLLVFVAGTFVMRSAGCVINDLADRNIDGAVDRTRQRPLVTGAVTVGEAVALFLVLLSIAFVLVLQTNQLTVLLSLAGAALAACYPFMKRFTHLPQVVLGVAFSWGIPMAFAAQLGELPSALWAIFCGNLLWIIAYDTQYAMADRDDDLLIGIKSSAILFGRYDRFIIACLQILALFGRGGLPLRLPPVPDPQPGPRRLLQGFSAQQVGGAGDFHRHRPALRPVRKTAAPLTMDAQFLASLDQIDARDWNALTGVDYPFLRHEFLYGLERSGCTTAESGWQPCHLVLREGATPRAVLPLYLKSHSYGEYVFDWSWADAWRQAGLHYYPKLVSAIPFTPATGPRLSCNPGLATDTAWEIALGAIKEFAEARELSSWHLLFPEPDISESLLRTGLPQRSATQFHWFNQGYSDFDDFLSGFTSRKRKSLKRERKSLPTPSAAATVAT